MQKRLQFTQVRNGLFTKQHAEKLGSAWFLFCKYLSFINARQSKKDFKTKDVCIQIFPSTICKQLDIDKETWRDYHQTLINEGYITSAFLANSKNPEAIAVCIKKALL